MHLSVLEMTCPQVNETINKRRGTKNRSSKPLFSQLQDKSGKTVFWAVPGATQPCDPDYCGDMGWAADLFEEILEKVQQVHILYKDDGIWLKLPFWKEEVRGVDLPDAISRTWLAIDGASSDV